MVKSTLTLRTRRHQSRPLRQASPDAIADTIQHGPPLNAGRHDTAAVNKTVVQDAEYISRVINPDWQALLRRLEAQEEWTAYTATKDAINQLVPRLGFSSSWPDPPGLLPSDNLDTHHDNSRLPPVNHAPVHQPSGSAHDQKAHRVHSVSASNHSTDSTATDQSDLGSSSSSDPSLPFSQPHSVQQNEHTGDERLALEILANHFRGLSWRQRAKVLNKVFFARLIAERAKAYDGVQLRRFCDFHGVWEAARQDPERHIASIKGADLLRKMSFAVECITRPGIQVLTHWLSRRQTAMVGDLMLESFNAMFQGQQERHVAYRRTPLALRLFTLKIKRHSGKNAFPGEKGTHEVHCEQLSNVNRDDLEQCASDLSQTIAEIRAHVTKPRRSGLASASRRSSSATASTGGQSDTTPSLPASKPQKQVTTSRGSESKQRLPHRLKGSKTA
ncbi:hypothetical protein Q7P37_005724 [Cladosporium fusiforme]